MVGSKGEVSGVYLMTPRCFFLLGSSYLSALISNYQNHNIFPRRCRFDKHFGVIWYNIDFEAEIVWNIELGAEETTNYNLIGELIKKRIIFPLIMPMDVYYDVIFK